MKKLRHITFSTLAGLSAMLFFVLLALYAKSFFQASYYKRSSLHQDPQDPCIVVRQVLSTQGSLAMTRLQLRYGQPPWPSAWGTPQGSFNHPMFQRTEGWHLDGGFVRWPRPYWYHTTITPFPGTSARIINRTLIIPYWPLLAATALLPALKLRRLMQARRTRLRLLNGLCPACGFDLRATPDRCPECGMVSTVNYTSTEKPKSGRPI